jgi:hypothetical protein
MKGPCEKSYFLPQQMPLIALAVQRNLGLQFSIRHQLDQSLSLIVADQVVFHGSRKCGFQITEIGLRVVVL